MIASLVLLIAARSMTSSAKRLIKSKHGFGPNPITLQGPLIQKPVPVKLPLVKMQLHIPAVDPWNPADWRQGQMQNGYNAAWGGNSNDQNQMPVTRMTQRLQLGPSQQGYGQGGQQGINSRQQHVTQQGYGPSQQGYGRYSQQNVQQGYGQSVPWPIQQGNGQYSQQNRYNRSGGYGPYQQDYGYGGSVRDTLLSRMRVGQYAAGSGPSQQNYAQQGQQGQLARRGAGRYQANSGASQQNFARQGQQGQQYGYNQQGQQGQQGRYSRYQEGYGQYGQQYGYNQQGYNQQGPGYQMQMGGYSGNVRESLMYQMGAGPYQPSVGIQATQGAGPSLQGNGRYSQQNAYNLPAGQGPSQQGYGQQNVYNQQAFGYQQGGYGGNVLDSIKRQKGLGLYQATSGQSGQEYGRQGDNGRQGQQYGQQGLAAGAGPYQQGQQYGYDLAAGAAPYQQGYGSMASSMDNPFPYGQQPGDNVPYQQGYDEYGQQPLDWKQQKSYSGGVRDALFLSMNVGKFQGPFQPQQQPYDDNQAMQGKPFLGNFQQPQPQGNYQEPQLPPNAGPRNLRRSGTTIDITEGYPSQNPQGLFPVDDDFD